MYNGRLEYQHAPMPYRPTHPTAIDPAAQPEPDYDTRGLLAAISAMFMWSTGNIMVRSLDMPGFQIAFWRITLSAVVYWLFVTVRRRRITWEQFKASAPAAISISLEIAVFFVAIKNTTVANATIIGALQPIVLLAVLSRFGERITRWLIGITFMAFIGVGLVVLGIVNDCNVESVGRLSFRGGAVAVQRLLLLRQEGTGNSSRSGIPDISVDRGIAHSPAVGSLRRGWAGFSYELAVVLAHRTLLYPWHRTLPDELVAPSIEALDGVDVDALAPRPLCYWCGDIPRRSDHTDARRSG